MNCDYKSSSLLLWLCSHISSQMWLWLYLINCDYDCISSFIRFPLTWIGWLWLYSSPAAQSKQSWWLFAIREEHPPPRFAFSRVSFIQLFIQRAMKYIKKYNWCFVRTGRTREFFQKTDTREKFYLFTWMSLLLEIWRKKQRSADRGFYMTIQLLIPTS